MSVEKVLSSLVEAEHAAVYGYGVLGARLDEATRRAAALAFDGHRLRRDQAAAALRDRGGDVPVALPAYDVTVSNRAQALALAVRLEVGMGQRWRDLVTVTDDPGLRRLGVAGLTESAVRAAEWRAQQGAAHPTVALPGV